VCNWEKRMHFWDKALKRNSECKVKKKSLNLQENEEKYTKNAIKFS